MDEKINTTDTVVFGKAFESAYNIDVEDSSPVDRYSRFTQSQQRGIRIASFGMVLEPTLLYEIIEAARISPLPGVARVFKGLVNHRSNVTPVYDLAELTEETPSSWERKRLLILNSGKDSVAVVLYDLPVQVRTGIPVSSDSIPDLPAIFRRHTRSVYRNNDLYWLILDNESFFFELSTLCLRY